MLRPANWTRPAGVSPAWVGTGAPSSRPGALERSGGLSGVSRASLEEARSRAVASSELCSLVRPTMGEPTAHVTAKAMSVRPCSGVGLAGVTGVREMARDHGLVRNRRDPSAWPASGKDRPQKPMVKSCGGQQESDGVVVPVVGARQHAPEGKGPRPGPASNHGHHPIPEGGVTMSRRPSVSRRRENRTYGLKGGWGNRAAMRFLRP